MPPKPRGRGGRGRGGTARGGSVANTSQEAAVPNQETTVDQATPRTEDASPSTIVESPQIPAPRQRLDGLAEPASRSASPAVRRARGKKGVVAAPTFTGRRSKAERDARNSEIAAREREKNQMREKEEAKLKRMTDSRRGKTGTNRGRASYGSVSGPFSDPSRRKEQRQSALGGFGGFGGGGGSGSRGTLVKSEGGGGGGGSSGSRAWSASMKREEVGYASSDDDDQVAGLPRMDIDTIQLSSDDNDDEPKDIMALPVRIRRREHRERIVGLNTDAGEEMPSKNIPKVEDAGALPATTGHERTANKGKGKAKDVEIIGERRQYKGVWQDSDSDAKVKTEPTSDDEQMADAQPAGASASPVKAGKRAENATESERKPKPRPPKGVVLTSDERAEMERYQDDLRALRLELGPPIDASGDVDMDSAGKATVRDGVPYLFQLPPNIPELTLPTIKKEATDNVDEDTSNVETTDATTTTKSARPPEADSKRPIVKKEAAPIKKEEEFSNPRGQIPARRRFPSGFVGKLRVHQSGRTTLDWGGTSYELTPGDEADFVEEAVSLSIVPEAVPEPEADAGEAVSFGSIRGKFLLKPDVGQLLG